MQINVELPDDTARHPNPGREALEALAIEGYRSGALTHHQARQLLGLSRFEFDGFLKGERSNLKATCVLRFALYNFTAFIPPCEQLQQSILV